MPTWYTTGSTVGWSDVAFVRHGDKIIDMVMATDALSPDTRAYLRVLNEVENSLYRCDPISPLAERATQQAVRDIRLALLQLKKKVLKDEQPSVVS